MDRLIYTAMSGASQSMARQAVTTHNLANLETPGFKAELAAFRAVPVRGAGMPTRAVTAATTPGSDFSAGPTEHTERSLDVALDDKGWLAVQTDDGGEAYTRAGNLQVDALGLLRSGRHPVLSSGGEPIVLPIDASITIADDGVISALQDGELPSAVAQVAQLKLAAHPDDAAMLRGGDGLFRPQWPDGRQAEPLQPDPTVRVRSGVLEHSNVSATESMLTLIADARRFEMQTKVLQLADESARAANQLLDPG